VKKKNLSNLRKTYEMELNQKEGKLAAINQRATEDNILISQLKKRKKKKKSITK